MLSIPILLALGGTLLFLIRVGGMKLVHALMGVVVGAQVSATILGREVGVAVSAAGQLLRSVFT